MKTPKLVAVEVSNSRFVVRVKNGPRPGTIFSTNEGWYYQFDGTPEEGPLGRDAEEALGIMAVAGHEHMIKEDPRA